MKLTEDQTNSLWDNGQLRLGLQIVSARAGTGKTTLVTEYCADLIDKWDTLFRPWQGVAMLSYTNVAKDEIKSKLQASQDSLELLKYPHSIETIDSFLNNKIFLPHGSSAMGFSGGRPKLVGEPFSTYKSKDTTVINKFGGISHLDCGYIFDKSYYGIDGRIYPNFGKSKHKDNGKMTVAAFKDDKSFSIPWFNTGGVESKNVQELRSYKQTKHKEGLCSQADANYFAYKTLIESEQLTKSLIKRYPVFIVDEAQDMTEVQHAIIDHLINSGLENVIMIGDEQQAIYEWNTARPELFTEKVSDDKWLSSEITGTFRNSQNICNALNRHTISGNISPADNSRSVDYDDAVEVVDWSIKDENCGQQFKTIIDSLAEHLSSKEPHNGKELSLAVLARSKEDALHYRAFCIDEQGAQGEIVQFEHSHSKDMLKVIHYLAIGDRYQAFKTYERILRRASNDKDIDALRSEVLHRIGADDSNTYSYRKALYSDVQNIESHITAEIPTMSSLSTISDWQLRVIPEDVIAQIKEDYTSPLLNDQSITNILLAQNDKPVDYHSVHKNVRLVFSTVHGVKGETYDGVLYALREKSLPCGCSTGSTNLNLKITTHDILKCESKRIQYVAMSRAAQTLRVAVASDKDDWKALLITT